MAPCLLPKISGVKVTPCLLPKISGVKVTPSVTSVESSEQFWRICEPWENEPALKDRTRETEEIEPNRAIDNNSYPSFKSPASTL